MSCDLTLPIIVISGHGGLDTAVAAIRRGAFDFIEKPFEASRLLHLVARATASERLKFEYEQLREKAGPSDALTGTSAAIHTRSEEHTSELPSLMPISYAVFCMKK